MTARENFEKRLKEFQEQVEALYKKTQSFKQVTGIATEEEKESFLNIMHKLSGIRAEITWILTRQDKSSI